LQLQVLNIMMTAKGELQKLSALVKINNLVTTSAAAN
jgi:hypothetical protein